MAEMMFATQLSYPQADIKHANSLLSGILNCMYGLGQALGPILGAFLYDQLGFRYLCGITTGIVATFALLFLLCANGCEAYSSTCKSYRGRHRK